MTAMNRERLKLTQKAASCFGAIIWRLWFRRIIFTLALLYLTGCGTSPKHDYPTSDRERWQFMYEHGQITLPEYQKLLHEDARKKSSQPGYFPNHVMPPYPKNWQTWNADD